MQKVARNTRSCLKVAEQLVESPKRRGGGDFLGYVQLNRVWFSGSSDLSLEKGIQQDAGVFLHWELLRV